MSILFSGGELLEIAMDIERNGAAFYQALADQAKNKDTGAIYEHLAREEEKHLNTFKGMLDTVGKYQPPEAYAEEYMLYLKSLADSSVFSNVTQAKEKAKKVASESEALDIGIQAEKDSILFYTEMQNFVKPADQKAISWVIDEEKAHLRQLSQLQQTMTEAG